MIISSREEEASVVIAEFDRTYEAQKPDLDEGFAAHRRYFPIDYGKWDPENVKIMEEEGRHPLQIDIASPRIDTLAGSIVSDLPDPSWIPVRGQRSQLTEAVALKYFSDKDISNYDDVYMKVFIDGLVHAGDLIVTEAWKDGVPYIRFERVIHGFLIWDPYWITDDDRDAEVYYRVAHMNPVRLKNKYGETCPELEQAIEEWRRDRSRVSNNVDKDKQKPELGKVGDELQVIEKHWIEEIHTKRLVGRRTEDNFFMPFPIKKSREYLQAFAQVNGIDWETVEETPYDDKVEYVSTVVRDLRLPVQSKVKGKIQVRGLSAHHFTPRRWMNRNMGIMASIADVEDTINKRESHITDIIGKTTGGAELVNEKAFPDEASFKKYMKNKNRNGYIQRAPLDDIVNDVFIKSNPNVNTAVLQNQVDRMLTQYLPLVSRVSESLTSMSDSNEPGILFERKFQTNMIANTALNRNIRQFLNNVWESYFFQYSITYGNIPFLDVPERGSEKTAIVLNQRVGSEVFNWVGDTPRCRVVVAENMKSQTYQMRWRSIWAESMDVLSKTVQVTGGITIPYLLLSIKNFFGTIEVKEEDKGAVKIMDDMTMMIARLKLVAEASTNQTKIGQDTLTNAQIDMQLQQIWQQLQAVQGQKIQPLQHTELVASRQIQYPNQGSNINPQPAEAVSEGAITPAMTGVPA